jgi:hypothetical protein
VGAFDLEAELLVERDAGAYQQTEVFAVRFRY